ncbi:MAG: DNA polymerase III subunit delta', partial [Calditrichia bacterium]
METIQSFNPDIGHENIQEQVLRAITNDHLPHAYLFYGPEGTGKDAFAINLAKLLNCEKGPLYICGKCAACLKVSAMKHPDVQFIFPAPASSQVKAEDISEALAEKAQNPFRRLRFPGKNTFISIDTVRELKREAKFKLYEGKKKVFIISEADEMRPEAANAF